MPISPEDFLSKPTEGEMSTKQTPIPEGDYLAVIDKLEFVSIPTKNGEAPAFNVNWKIDNPTLQQELGRPLFVRQTLWLDITDSDELDNSPGRNVALGRLRAAVGQNSPSKAWSPNELLGCVANIAVKQSFKKNSDGSFDTSVIYENVSRVSPA